MMDVVHETEEASSMHDLPSRDMFQFQSRLNSHHIPLFSTHHRTVDPPSYSQDNHDNEDRDQSHSTSCFPVHQNRDGLPSFSGPKLQLELTSDGEIDGPDRVEFKMQLGVLAQNSYRFPLIYTSFDKMPQHVIGDRWDEIKKNTTLTDEAKRDVIKDFNGKWRQRKYEVKKKNFTPYGDDEEMLKELSQDLVPPKQWEYMLEYWKLDATKVACQLNEKMREKDEQMWEEMEQMRKEIEEMREEREQTKGLLEQLTKKLTQTQAQMTQEVVENAMSYFGLGNFPIALFGPSITPFQPSATSFRPSASSFRPTKVPLRPFDMRQVLDSSSTDRASSTRGASSTMGVGASRSSNDSVRST
ncbi:hypothetical protein BUALT_Bualt07G0055200 [Buddleja alternifolia]|uniref:Uncharacterized protein n=1 Tax=Buddleja alternifolia TaxID=168488 RepID=A0AAV6X7M1_9LAMI|nr:hypothetical protein BUALT_Bualt07G0055200 [Buddleja alternifolia]